MLHVKTIVAPSNIHGLGLFADQFIPKGTTIWNFTEGFDQKFNPEQIVAFPQILQDFFSTYSSISKKTGKNILCGDQGNYINHSKDPNINCKYIEGEEEFIAYALRDIEAGEEITENYSEYDNSKEIIK